MDDDEKVISGSSSSKLGTGNPDVTMTGSVIITSFYQFLRRAASKYRLRGFLCTHRRDAATTRLSAFPAEPWQTSLSRVDDEVSRIGTHVRRFDILMLVSPVLRDPANEMSVVTTKGPFQKSHLELEI